MSNHEPRNDEAHVARLSPDAIMTYLASRGWEKGDSEERGGAPLYQWMKRRLDAVRVPLRSHYSDYGRCVLVLLNDISAAEDRSTFGIVSAIEAMPPVPVAEDVRHDVVQKLLFAMRIYPNYRVDSRGPAGCLLDAIEALEPQTAQKIRDGVDLHELVDRAPGDDL